MNGPPRLTERGCDDPVAELLRSARSDRPSENSRQRALAVAARLSTAAAAGTAASASALSKSALFIKWLGLGALGGALTMLGVAHLETARPRARRPAPVVTRPAPLREAPSGASLPPPAPPTRHTAEGARRPSRDNPARRPARPRKSEVPAASAAFAPIAPASSSAPQDTFSAEIAQIDAARRALARGDGAAALQRIARYEADFDTPHFGQEATVLRVQALELTGQRDRAEQLARRFLASHPNSALAPRVRTLIGDRP